MPSLPELAEADLRQIVDIARYLGEESHLESLLSRIIDSARELLDAERATVFLYDEAHNELYCRLGTNVSEIRISTDQGVAGRCARCRQVVPVHDCEADPDFENTVDQKTGFQTRNLLAAPLLGIQGELVGVLQVLNKRQGTFAERDEAIVSALASQCAVALQRAHFFEDRLKKEKLERDLALARQIQQDLLPKQMPEPAGYEIVGWTRPADQTGGDLYDVGPGGASGPLLLLCDATGHGIGPALSVSQVRTMFRLAARMHLTIADSVSMINEQLIADLPDGRFVTAFVGMLDAANHQIEYRSGGQAPLLHVRADGTCQQLPASAMPMGIAPGVEAPAPDPIVLAPADLLAVPSDGLFEQQNEQGQAFGVDRLIETIAAHRTESGDALIQAIREALDTFTSEIEQADDMSILLVRRTADSG